jgi:hypothetical protein
LKKTAAIAGALCLLFTFLFALPASAAQPVEYHIRNITVALEDDGSATVTEVWNLSATEGTEAYMKMLNLDEQQVSDLAVFENGAAFENIGEWDVNASFDEKAGKCGIVTRADGYELCWGLGAYGRHTFTVSYRVTGMVKGYADAGVILQTFVEDVAYPINSVTVTIYRQGLTFTTENTGVWAEGSAEGEIWVRGGQIEAYTTAPYQPGSEFTVMVQFAQGMFSPVVRRGETFEEVKRRELEGSGYAPGDGGYENEYEGGYSSGGGWSVASSLDRKSVV